LDDALLSYGHLKFFTLGPDMRHRTSEMQVILYSVQCCYAVHWTDKNRLVAGLQPDPLVELSVLPRPSRWISGGRFTEG